MSGDCFKIKSDNKKNQNYEEDIIMRNKVGFMRSSHNMTFCCFFAVICELYSPFLSENCFKSNFLCTF